MRYIFYVLLSLMLLLGVGCNESKNNIPLDDITGSYTNKGYMHTTIEIVLKSDGEFEENSSSFSCIVESDGTSSTSNSQYSGSYQYNGSRIHFRPDCYSYRGYGDSLSNIWDTIPDHRVDVFRPVIYRGIRYIFPAEPLDEISDWASEKNHFIYLANVFNRSTIDSVANFQFWVDSQCRRKIAFFHRDISDDFPDEYRNYILDMPILAKIRTMQVVPGENRGGHIKNTFTINKGAWHGVKNGMKFYPTKENSMIREIRVDKIGLKTSKGHIFLSAKDTIDLLVTEFSTQNYKFIKDEYY